MINLFCDIMSKTKKDYIYNLLYQIFTVIFPIMLTPYTSRVLGAEALGIYSYVFTFVSFFIMFAKLGCSNLGQRLIAKNRDNKKKLSESFFSVYYIQFFLTIIMTILFLIFAFLFLKDNIVIALIKSISLFATIFDISWVFTGLEKFKLNVMKNVVIKIITFIFIILFVKNSNDLWIYALILTLSNLLTNLLWINFLKNEIIFVNVKIKNILKNLKSSFILFIPILAKSIYTSMDKIMIGSLTTMNELGIYSQGAKFMSLPYVFTNALSNLMLSKNSNLVAKNQKDQMKKNIEKSLEFIMFL